MFCAPGLVFSGSEGVGSYFHVLRAHTCFRPYRQRRVPFSCSAPRDTFSAVSSASGHVFMFCAPGHIFGGTECVGSRFHVLRSIKRLNSFSAVPRSSDPVFMFCAPGLIFDGSEGVGSCFHVLRSRTHFRRFRGRRVYFSCFALPYTFSAIRRASGPVFMFCAPGLVFVGTDGVRCRFNVLRSRTRFRRCGGRRVPFLCFALPDSFSAVPRASAPVFMFCVPVLVLGDTDGVRSRFHVVRSRTRFRRYRRPQLPFSCFARPKSFSAVPRASSHVF
jgi:hypothetical protein